MWMIKINTRIKIENANDKDMCFAAKCFQLGNLTDFVKNYYLQKRVSVMKTEKLVGFKKEKLITIEKL